MKQRILNMSIDEAIEAFELIKWKFFEVSEDASSITLEVPRGYRESFIVEAKVGEDLETIKAMLVYSGFIEQEVKRSPDW